jgi:hypothetical protein
MNAASARPARRPAPGFCALAAIVLPLLFAAGCASDVQNYAPSTPPGPGAINTGTYPNLNVPARSAATPISDADKASLEAKLGSAKGRQGVGGIPTLPQNDGDRLRQLGAHHAEDTLRQIDGE